ncbi:hypothetical protein J6590_032541 [Homalodisca vitripennis]|nr:hypothetical protein J6590_032541 [Homalodisca vitripennis]
MLLKKVWHHVDPFRCGNSRRDDYEKSEVVSGGISAPVIVCVVERASEGGTGQGGDGYYSYVDKAKIQGSGYARSAFWFSPQRTTVRRLARPQGAIRFSITFQSPTTYIYTETIGRGPVHRTYQPSPTAYLTQVVE